MTSAPQVRAALDALFDSPTQPGLRLASPAPAIPALPENLDAAILADVGVSFEADTHRWFTGRDASNIRRIFRFQRGQALAVWHETLRKQSLTSVYGPYRNPVQAERAK